MADVSFAYELPDLGDPSTNIISNKQETELGKQFMKKLSQEVTIEDDPLLNDYIQSLGNRLVAHTTGKGRKIHFFIVDERAINAFSIPGGYIGLNSGTILETKSESELAAVLAHEVAHTTQHHLEQNIAKAKQLNVPVMAAILASILVGTTTHGASSNNAASAVAMSTMAGGTQSMLNFSREHEAEADQIAMKTLYSAGFDPSAMPSFFSKMMAMESGDNPPAYLLTHPLTGQRLADAENRSFQYPKVKVGSSKSYYLMQARVAVLTSQTQPAIDYFKNQVLNNGSNFAALYGYSLALEKNRQFDLAQNNLESLTKDDPREVIYSMALAEVLIKKHDFEQAVSILKKAYAEKPNYYPLDLQYAESLIAAGQIDAAKGILNKLIQKYPNDTKLYDLLAQTEFKGGQEGYAYYTKAKSLEAEGDNKGAIVLLQKGLELPNLSINSKAMLQSELARVKALLADSKD